MHEPVFNGLAFRGAGGLVNKEAKDGSGCLLQPVPFPRLWREPGRRLDSLSWLLSRSRLALAAGTSLGAQNKRAEKALEEATALYFRSRMPCIPADGVTACRLEVEDRAPSGTQWQEH
eukprot:1136992-Pelagomonas_calceolata.AAC.3